MPRRSSLQRAKAGIIFSHQSARQVLGFDGLFFIHRDRYKHFFAIGKISNLIADWLATRGIACRYDAKFRSIGEFQICPDFYLPELDVYIEYWRLDTPQYKMSMYKKQMLYQQAGKRLISIYPPDLPRLDALLHTKLQIFGYHLNNDITPSDIERSEDSGREGSQKGF